MKRARLRPVARQDALDEVRYYRRQAGTDVALRLRQAIEDCLAQIEHNPGIGSPRLGQAIGATGLRTWRIAGFPLATWYIEREDYIDVARIVGHRQDALNIEVGASPI